MPVTVTQAAATVVIRAATSPDDIPAPVQAAMDVLFPAAVALVEDYAPDAPDAVLDAATVRLLGWMWEADPNAVAIGRALEVSGTAALLRRWQIHRAGVLGADGVAPAPTPGGGGNVPAPPGEGHYILTADNGALEWVEFPQP